MSEITLKIKNPPWWNRRSKCEKGLIAFAALLILIIVIILSLHLSRNSNGQDCNDICLTPDCVKTAAQVLEMVDLNANPCDDFYQFACGNFIKNTIIPDDKTSIDSFSIVGDEVSELMNNLLKKPIVSTDIKPFVLVKRLYQACMNTTDAEQNSVEKFKHLIKNAGGWPVLEGAEWNEDNFDWISTSYKFMEVGFSHEMFFTFQIYGDKSNSSRNALYLDQLSFPLDKIFRNGFNETIFQVYYEYMTSVAIGLGATEEDASKDMKDVAEFIISLARITLPQEERRNSSVENNPMSIANLTTSYNYVPWLQYLNKMLHPYKTVNSSYVITVTVLPYFEKLEDLIKKTSKRVLANYMFWLIAYGNVRYLDEKLRDLFVKFYSNISGQKEKQPRWRECTGEVLGSLDIASGALFVRNFFKKEAKVSVAHIATHIQEQFIKILDNVDWMDSVTKKHALEKAKAIHLHTAYPDELLDDQKLEEYYQNLTLQSSDYLGCKLNLSLFFDYIIFLQLDQKRDKKDWRNHGYVTRVQGYYDRSENSIEFLPGILRNVFFDDKKPKYMNYGAIGHIVGHEITHGFDDVGRQHDKKGNLVNWWQPKTKEAFEAKAQCIIDQYGNITVPEVQLNINGINTQGENVADNGGINLAYAAYKEWSQKNGPEKVLPGLPYTPEQMFWIAVANIWCSVETSRNLKVDVLQANHAPKRYRVNVPLMNSKYFIKDFNCKPNSRMNPPHKCQVW